MSNSIEDTIEALVILSKYPAIEPCIQADRDMLYGPELKDGVFVTSVDTVRLVKLGWHFNEGYNCWATVC